MKKHALSAVTLAAVFALASGLSPAAQARAFELRAATDGPSAEAARDADFTHVRLQSDHPRGQDFDDFAAGAGRPKTLDNPDIHENVAAAPELSPGSALSATAVLLGGAAILAAMRRPSAGSGTPLAPRRRR